MAELCLYHEVYDLNLNEVVTVPNGRNRISVKE